MDLAWITILTAKRLSTHKPRCANIALRASATQQVTPVTCHLIYVCISHTCEKNMNTCHFLILVINNRIRGKIKGSLPVNVLEHVCNWLIFQKAVQSSSVLQRQNKERNMCINLSMADIHKGCVTSSCLLQIPGPVQVLA